MELFRERLENILNRHHELYRLAGLIDWSVFEKEFGKLYAAKKGRPGIPIRLMVGLTLAIPMVYQMRLLWRNGLKIRIGNTSAARRTSSINSLLIPLPCRGGESVLAKRDVNWSWQRPFRQGFAPVL